MKKLFVQLIKFACIGIVIYLGLLLCIPPKLISNFYDVEWREKLFIQDARSLGSVDVLILGSSHVFKSFDPRIFKKEGYQLLNLASPSQTPENSYYILKDFFNGSLSSTGKAPIPKVIVHELYCKTIGDRTPLESYIKSVENYPSTYNFLTLGILTRNVTAINMFFSTLLKNKFNIYEETRTYSDAPQYVKYGFYSSDNVRGKNHMRYDIPIEQMTFDNTHAKTMYMREKVRDSKICEGAPSAHQMKYLKKIVDIARSYGTPTVLVVAPIPKDFSNNIKDYNRIISNISTFAQDNNILFIEDFGQAQIDDSTDFSDRDHLNSMGATKASKFFIDKLKTVGYLK